MSGLAAATSLNTWTPLFWVMPPKKKPSAPEPLIFAASARKFAALVSMPSLPSDLDALLPGELLDLVGDALPVDLLVVQDVELVTPSSFMYATCAAAWMWSAGTTRP